MVLSERKNTVVRRLLRLLKDAVKNKFYKLFATLTYKFTPQKDLYLVVSLDQDIFLCQTLFFVKPMFFLGLAVNFEIFFLSLITVEV